MVVNSVTLKSDSTFTFLVLSESFTHNYTIWILLYFSADTENPHLLILLFIAADIKISMLSHCILSNSMKASCSSVAMDTHCIRVKPILPCRSHCSEINEAMDGALFAESYANWAIAAAWADAAQFEFYDYSWVIDDSRYFSTTFKFGTIIMYQSTVKHVS